MIFDGHLDLSMNATIWNRDLTKPVSEIRAREAGMTDKKDRGNNVVSLPAMRQGGIGLCVATQIAHSVSVLSPLVGWHSPEIAWAQTQAQIAWYRAMCEAGQMRQVCNKTELKEHVGLWNDEASDADQKPVGFILSLEGADSLLTLDHLHRAYEYGLRIVGPAHYGPGRYAYGTGETDGLTAIGPGLLREMDSLGMILDATHLTDAGFIEALEIFNGPVWASHHNCRALVPHQRQLTDEQIRILIDRGAIIGGAMDTWMMIPDWERGVTTPQATGVNLNHLIDHIDHVCQIAGNANHSCIGSDLDGAFGTEQSPIDVRTIADLASLNGLLSKRGYSDADCEAILWKNAVNFFERNLP